MQQIEKSTRVEVPVAVAYDHWAQFEKFPQFMEGVREVRKIDDRTLHWRAVIGGKEVEWDATILQQKPHERIAWRSTGGARNAGSVTFEPAGRSETRVTLQLEYEPESMAERTASALGIVSARIEGDLRRFKTWVERARTPPPDVRDIPPE